MGKVQLALDTKGIAAPHTGLGRAPFTDPVEGQHQRIVKK
jgi:hypothetical protein